MSEEASAPTKTVVEVPPDIHSRLRDGAGKTSNSLKRFTSLILDYALAKFEAGEIVLREPAVEEIREAEGGEE